MQNKVQNIQAVIVRKEVMEFSWGFFLFEKFQIFSFKLLHKNIQSHIKGIITLSANIYLEDRRKPEE